MYTDSSLWDTTHHSDDDQDCVPLHKYEWCQTYLGECVSNDVQFAGFILGLLSNVCWLVAQGPQIWKNYKNGTSESLSIAFLAAWLIGDITNLVGCVLTNTTRTQLYTAVYFCIIDGMMVSQWLYYSRKNRLKEERNLTLNISLLPVLVALPVVGAGFFAVSAGGPMTTARPVHTTGRTLLGIVVAHNRTELIGYICGCVSGFLYFTSRIPQIVTNFERKTTEGLEPLMFIMAVLGNVFYAAGVLTKGLSTQILIIRLPWLVGSIGTLNFDFTIVIQYFYYGTDDRIGWRESWRQKRSDAAEREMQQERTALLSPREQP